MAGLPQVRIHDLKHTLAELQKLIEAANTVGCRFQEGPALTLLPRMNREVSFTKVKLL